MTDPADDFAFRFVSTPSDGTQPEVLFSIKGDGTIERGPAFTTTDAMSLEFWDAIERILWAAPRGTGTIIVGAQ